MSEDSTGVLNHSAWKREGKKGQFQVSHEYGGWAAGWGEQEVKTQGIQDLGPRPGSVTNKSYDFCLTRDFNFPIFSFHN